MDRGKHQQRRIALVLQYDGTAYHGWQLQDNAVTVQGELEKAVLVLAKEKTRVIASGRTDTGVHAYRQVVHFDITRDITLTRLCMGLNGILPPEISVKNAYLVDNDFHARFSALEREYRYLIYNYPLRTPFMRYRAMWVNHELDVDYMSEVADYLIGEMDFASFCKKISVEKGTVRKINRINISRNGPLIEITIAANAFLHNMIRIIVGTIVQMNKNNEKSEFIKEIIERRDRDYSGETAPPYGLYLMNVSYDPPLRTMESAFKS